MAPRYGLDEKMRIAQLLKEKFGDDVTRKEIKNFLREGGLDRCPNWILNDETIRSARGVYNMTKTMNMIDVLRNGGGDSSAESEGSTEETTENTVE
jgi:hypothetical protein